LRKAGLVSEVSTSGVTSRATGPTEHRLGRLQRAAPLTGLLFVVLVLIGGPGLEGSTPGAKASGAHVISFFSAHRERERIGVIILALAFVAFLFFAAFLRSRWRSRSGLEGLSALVLAAATVLVVGQSLTEGVGFALTTAPASLSPSSAQTLNLLANDLVVTSAIGFLSFGISAGLAILRGVDLPGWLGWSALLIAVLFVIPPIEFVGFLLLLVWITVVSVLSYRRAVPGHVRPG
jgi:hypothetical protein